MKHKLSTDVDMKHLNEGLMKGWIKNVYDEKPQMS